MGKELLRNALHALLEALAKKRLPSGEDGKLIGDGGGQRSKLQSALEEIDEWDADDDVRELGGDLDEEVVMSRVKERFITREGLPPFIAALSQCMWAREHRELVSPYLPYISPISPLGLVLALTLTLGLALALALALTLTPSPDPHQLARKKRKDAAEAGMRRDEGRDWERLIFPPIPERATLPERAKWRERGETFHGEAVDSGEVVDVALLGEWSPQFNALVDLYASHLEDFVRWRSLSPEGAVAAAGGSQAYRDAPARPRELSASPPARSLSRTKRSGTVSNLLAFGPATALALADDGAGGGLTLTLTPTPTLTRTLT